MAHQKRFKEVVENKYKGWNYIFIHGFKIERKWERQLPLGTAQILHHYQKHMQYT